MKYLKRLLLAVGGIVFFLANSAITGAVIAATNYLGYWAYPTFFGVNILLSALVFLVLIPADRQKKVAWPWLQKYLVVDETRFHKGIWPWVRRQGPFFLVLVCSFFPGPFFAALLIRFLGLPDQKAWGYAIVTNMVSTTVSISLYLGVLDAIRSFFASVFAQ